MKNLSGLDLLPHHFSVLTESLGGFPFYEVLTGFSLVPKIHVIVVRADSSKLSSDLCAIKQQSKIRKKETFTVSSVFGFTLVQFTLFKKVCLVMSPPLLPHLLPSQEGSLFKFSSGSIAQFVVPALVYLLLGLWSWTHFSGYTGFEQLAYPKLEMGLGSLWKYQIQLNHYLVRPKFSEAIPVSMWPLQHLNVSGLTNEDRLRKLHPRSLKNT